MNVFNRISPNRDVAILSYMAKYSMSIRVVVRKPTKKPSLYSLKNLLKVKTKTSRTLVQLTVILYFKSNKTNSNEIYRT